MFSKVAFLLVVISLIRFCLNYSKAEHFFRFVDIGVPIEVDVALGLKLPLI